MRTAQGDNVIDGGYSSWKSAHMQPDECVLHVNTWREYSLLDEEDA